MENKTRRWSPLSYLTDTDKNIAIIILNRPLHDSYKKLKALWRNASVTICADGGANELYKLCEEKGHLDWIPQFITGDFDSIKKDVMEYYNHKGTQVITTADQDYTDFTKAIRFLLSNCNDQVTAIIAVAEFSGLLDQTVGNVNTLFEAAKITELPVILLASDCLAFLLQPGKHSIDVKSEHQGPKCGLLPIGGKCESVTTTGLKWNLSNHALQFGELISTSNTFDGSGVVTIETSHPLIWTMEVK